MMLAGRVHASLPGDLSGRGDDVGHAHVLVVDEQRVREVPGVLAERFAVIAEHDEQRVVVQPPRRAVRRRSCAERRVAFVQRIEVAGEVVRAVERPGAALTHTDDDRRSAGR